MSHSGNNPSRRLRSLQKLQNTKEGEQFYNPSVFRYKCFGYLQLNSDDKGSSGVCRGLQSRMERVANMVPDTREGSIKKFLDASADLGTYVDSDDNSSDQKVKEIYTSRTLIYKNDQEDTRRIQPAKSSPFPEDELINRTEWSCWGSTSVHYLVLEPIQRKVNNSKQPRANAPVPGEDALETQKKADDMMNVLTEQLRNFDKDFDQSFSNNDKDKDKKEENIKNEGRKKTKKNAQEVAEAWLLNQKNAVAKAATPARKDEQVSAITPENIGLSMRKIDSSVGHFTVTDIGSIRICVETSAPVTADSTNNNNNSGEQKNSQKIDDKDNSKAQQGQTPAEERKMIPTMELKKFYEFTVKVAHQMEYNVKEIREAVQDDFPGRTYKFGTKVVHRFQKTSEQTFTYMGKILNSWWKSM